MSQSIAVSSIYFVLDKARIHLYIQMKEIAEELNLKLMYLPPYSPFLNPIENVILKWKNAVRRGAATNDTELRTLIQTSFEAITIEDCARFLRKMKTFVIRAVNREAIIE